MFAFAILVPLTVTSNATMIKRMGAAAWQRLHRWVYLAAAAAAVHFVMVVKSWPAEPLVYATIVAALLVIRCRICSPEEAGAHATGARARGCGGIPELNPSEDLIPPTRKRARRWRLAVSQQAVDCQRHQRARR